MARKYRKNNPFSHRKSDTIPIGDAIKDLLKAYRLQNKFDETRLINSWERLMGKTIASRTTKIYVKDQKLFVMVSSAPLKSELQLAQHKILEIFNDEIGQNIITEIVLL